MNSIPVALIIGIIVGAMILVSVSLTVRAVVQAFRRTTNSLAGQIIGGIADELFSGASASESLLLPPSQEARSISDMTSVYSAAIASDFPDLNLKQLISAAENKLCTALYAVQAGSFEASGLQPVTRSGTNDDGIVVREEKTQDEPFLLGVTPEYAALIERRIEALRSEGKVEVFERIHIHRSGIHKYEKRAGTCQITLQTAIEYLHYIKQNGNVVSGSQQTMEQARYNLYLICIYDESQLPSEQTTAIAMNCPNCGGTIKVLGHKKCEYCGAALQGIDIRVWRMNQYTEN
jgi:hypothetical protein